MRHGGISPERFDSKLLPKDAPFGSMLSEHGCAAPPAHERSYLAIVWHARDTGFSSDRPVQALPFHLRPAFLPDLYLCAVSFIPARVNNVPVNVWRAARINGQAEGV